MLLRWGPTNCPKERRWPICPRERSSPTCPRERRSPYCPRERRPPYCPRERKPSYCPRERKPACGPGEDRPRTQAQQKRRQCFKTPSVLSLTPSQSSEDEIQDNSGVAEALKYDNLATALTIAAAVVLLLLLYYLLRRGSLQFCICFADIWCGFKDSVDLTISTIKRKILDMIRNDGLCKSTNLQVFFDMDMCLSNTSDSMFATFRIVYFLIEKLILLMETART